MVKKTNKNQGRKRVRQYAGEIDTITQDQDKKAVGQYAKETDSITQDQGKKAVGQYAKEIDSITQNQKNNYKDDPFYRNTGLENDEELEALIRTEERIAAEKAKETKEQAQKEKLIRKIKELKELKEGDTIDDNLLDFMDTTSFKGKPQDQQNLLIKKWGQREVTTNKTVAIDSNNASNNSMTTQIQKAVNSYLLEQQSKKNDKDKEIAEKRKEFQQLQQQREIKDLSNQYVTDLFKDVGAKFQKQVAEEERIAEAIKNNEVTLDKGNLIFTDINQDSYYSNLLKDKKTNPLLTDLVDDIQKKVDAQVLVQKAAQEAAQKAAQEVNLDKAKANMGVNKEATYSFFNPSKYQYKPQPQQKEKIGGDITLEIPDEGGEETYIFSRDETNDKSQKNQEHDQQITPEIRQRNMGRDFFALSSFMGAMSCAAAFLVAPYFLPLIAVSAVFGLGSVVSAGVALDGHFKSKAMIAKENQAKLSASQAEGQNFTKTQDEFEKIKKINLANIIPIATVKGQSSNSDLSYNDLLLEDQTIEDASNTLKKNQNMKVDNIGARVNQQSQENNIYEGNNRRR